MAFITCSGASFGYETGVAVSDLDFAVNRGDYLCIVGENGSGKSTLIRGILRLKEPVTGRMQTGDDLKPDEIGYLPQQTVVQKDFPAGVFEVALSGRQNRRGFIPFYGKRDKQAALQNLERLGVAELKNRCYRELSGGQQQRVLLARALCATEKLLLLDEPVSGLDPLATSELYGLIETLNRKEGLTIVMVSHDIRSAVEYASHILHLGNKQLFFGKTADYLETPLCKRFLGGEKS
ncbi:MAG: metal ABC transporter ATP-binding protein [Oscillospiraceae bacterium]|nr:metal ABC transporter ATP-binding protein [Oscillospiraceae bacterium]